MAGGISDDFPDAFTVAGNYTQLAKAFGMGIAPNKVCFSGVGSVPQFEIPVNPKYSPLFLSGRKRLLEDGWDNESAGAVKLPRRVL